MALRKIRSIEKRGQDRPRVKASLKKGDMVMVISGGNGDKRPIRGKVGKLLRFVGKKKDRVILEGMNLVTKHQKQAGPDKPAGKVMKEASIHISNIMYYAEKIKKPVRIKSSKLADGTRVRGYTNPESKEFVQI